MSHFSVRSLIVGITFAALAAATLAANAQVLDPAAYTSGGALSLSSGTYTINTDTLKFAGNSGVLSNGIAVFDFSSINIGANATVNVVGSHPLALLSLGDATFGAGSSFNLNGGVGGAASVNQQGAAGIAGAGGYRGGAGPGTGPYGGDGGGFGGVGRGLGYFYGLASVDSPTYGNLLVKLEGGSGGNSGAAELYGPGAPFYGAGGGGGGGAIEISAKGNLTLAGNLNANGGDGRYPFESTAGGGGAGGGILLAANQISLTNTGYINANGGSGTGFWGPFTDWGGGGGGGRITFQTQVYNGFANNGSINVNGGFGQIPFNGGDGVITVNGRVTNTPAPGSLLVAVLGAVPVVAMLRRRRK